VGEWKLLAQGQPGNSIQQCPAGHIHIDYGNLTLRLSKQEFLTFAIWVMKAAAVLSHSPLSNMLDGRQPGGFSDN
jgi:hypothetical protein